MTKKGIIKKRIIITLVLFFTVFTVGCNLVQVNPEKDAQEIVAEIGEETITKGDLNYYMAEEELMMKLQGQEMPRDEETVSQIEGLLLNSAAEINLIVQLAQEEGVEAKGEDIEGQIEQTKEMFQELIEEEEYRQILENNGITSEEFDAHLRETLLNMEYMVGLQEIVLADIEVSDEDVEEFYEENKEGFSQETVEAKHILASNEELAEEIADRAKDGQDFDELMEEYQEDEDVIEAANLGEFPYGSMVPEFSEAAFGMESGETSDPVETEFGFHIIKVENRNEPPIPDFEEVEESIRDQLLQQAQSLEFQTYVNDRVEDMKFEIYPEKL